MKVKDFIKWLEKQDQELEVCVIENSTEYEEGAFGSEEVNVSQAVCFDDPAIQAKKTQFCLILGIE